MERGELAASKYKVEILVKSVTSFDYEVFIVSRIHTYSRSCTQIFTIVFPSPIANREQGENNTWKQLNRALIKRIYMKYVRIDSLIGIREYRCSIKVNERNGERLRREGNAEEKKAKLPK